MPNWKVGEKTDLKYWREKRSMERQRERHMAAAAAVKLIDQKRRIYRAVVSSWAWDSGAEDERAWRIWICACLFVLVLSVLIVWWICRYILSFFFLAFANQLSTVHSPGLLQFSLCTVLNPTTCSQRNASNYTLSFIPRPFLTIEIRIKILRTSWVEEI